MPVNSCDFWSSFIYMKLLMWVRVCGIKPFNYMHWPLTKLCRKICRCRRILPNIKRSFLLFPISIHLYENLKVLADFKLLFCTCVCIKVSSIDWSSLDIAGKRQQDKSNNKTKNSLFCSPFLWPLSLVEQVLADWKPPADYSIAPHL